MGENNLILMILAGGDGTRMKSSSVTTPKPLLSTLDEPLLIRQIRQANEVGFLNIIVSTNPRDFVATQKTVKRFKVKASVLENIEHFRGSLPALEFAIKKTSSARILMSLADIYFLKNPFKSFKNLKGYALGVSRAFDKKELSLGGIVFTNNGLVGQIVEKPIQNTKGYRWNGLALFNRSDGISLTKFLKTHKPNSPEGDFLEYLRGDIGANFFFVESSDFINVNRFENLLVASMYRFSEIRNDEKISLLASDARKYLLSICKDIS